MSYLTIQFQYEDYNELNQECRDYIDKLSQQEMNDTIKDCCVLDNPEEMCINYTYDVKNFDIFWSHAKKYLFGHGSDVQEHIKNSSVVIYQSESTALEHPENHCLVLHHFDKNATVQQVH